MWAQINATGLPIGWVSAAVVPDPNDPRRFPSDWGGGVLKLLGILITALAVSQGVPFWLDLLNKFIVIRSTVKPTRRAATRSPKTRARRKTRRTTPFREGTARNKRRRKG